MKKIILTYIASIILSLSIITNNVQPIDHAQSRAISIDRTSNMQSSSEITNDYYLALGDIDPDTDAGH